MSRSLKEIEMFIQLKPFACMSPVAIIQVNCLFFTIHYRIDIHFSVMKETKKKPFRKSDFMQMFIAIFIPSEILLTFSAINFQRCTVIASEIRVKQFFPSRENLCNRSPENGLQRESSEMFFFFVVRKRPK